MHVQPAATSEPKADAVMFKERKPEIACAFLAIHQANLARGCSIFVEFQLEPLPGL